jgi:hypothetical protein
MSHDDAPPGASADPVGGVVARGLPSTRRAFLTSAGLGISALTLFGMPQQASAALPRFVEDAFDGLAAFVLPGNDAFSRQQGKTYPGPGAVAAAGGLVVRETLDRAIPLQLGELPIPAPGALGYALIMQSVAVSVAPLAIVGRFAHAFANLSWLQKREVLNRIDGLPGLGGSVIGYSGNALSTLAGLGAYSERAVYDRATKRLSGRPVSWDCSGYGGRSDGWPEFKGYFEDLEVSRP